MRGSKQLRLTEHLLHAKGNFMLAISFNPQDRFCYYCSLQIGNSHPSKGKESPYSQPRTPESCSCCSSCVLFIFLTLTISVHVNQGAFFFQSKFHETIAQSIFVNAFKASCYCFPHRNSLGFLMVWPLPQSRKTKVLPCMKSGPKALFLRCQLSHKVRVSCGEVCLLFQGHWEPY